MGAPGNVQLTGWWVRQMNSRRWFPLVLRTAKQKEHVEKVRRAEAGDEEPAPPPDQGMLLQDTSAAAKMHAAATRIQAHYRGHIVRKARAPRPHSIVVGVVGAASCLPRGSAGNRACSVARPRRARPWRQRFAA